MVYSVSPFSMLWNGDNYYMIGYSDSHEDIARFRVNRIERVTWTATIEAKNITEALHKLDIRLRAYNVNLQVVSIYENGKFIAVYE